jgi:hypothetical protein
MRWRDRDGCFSGSLAQPYEDRDADDLADNNLPAWELSTLFSPRLKLARADNGTRPVQSAMR